MNNNNENDKNEDAHLKIGKPSSYAGGIPAILHSLKHSVKEMGVQRGVQALLKVNQGKGFDCPGCAWPDPDDRRSMVEFCENGAKAVAEEATRKKIGKEFFEKHSLTELRSKTDYWLGQQGRLTLPMWKRSDKDHYEEISWDQAFQLLGTKLRALSSPHEAVFYTSGRTSNEAAFLYQLFVRLYGTNNLPDCSNMCHESSGVALNQVIGSGKGTVTLEDFQKAELILVIGQNPGTNHPRMLSALQQAKRRGKDLCKIVSINPLAEAGLLRFKHPQEIFQLLGPGTPITDLHLQVKINGDVALLKGIMKHVLEEESRHPGEILDHAFIQEFTSGFDDFVRALHLVSWHEITEESGIAEEDIRAAATLYIQSKATICCWAMGVTQHKNAVGNIQEIINLLLLKGNIGKPGAGACPVRGHSNVQGDRTMGICERPSPAFLQSLGKEFAFSPPTDHGYDVVETLRAMEENKVKVFISMGGNFISATPDTGNTCQVIKNCQLTVQISTKLNRSHVETGEQALILPCLGRTEVDEQSQGPQFVTVENSMGIVHTSRGFLPPISHLLKSEPAIVAGMALATLQEKIDWNRLIANYDFIRDHIANCIPGFADFNRRVHISQAPHGFALSHAVRDERKFLTSTCKANFTINTIPKINLQSQQFIMMTIRSHDQYNTTIYGPDDRYRGISQGRRVILMNSADIDQAALQDGMMVDLSSHFQGQERKAYGFRVVAYNIPKRCVATYFPETNVLIPRDHQADLSHTPASKSVVITVSRSQENVSKVCRIL